MWDFWPLFILGLICGVLIVRAWRVMTAPLPPARDPRKDWADWEAACQRHRAKQNGAGQ